MIDTELGTVLTTTPAEHTTIAYIFDPTKYSLFSGPHTVTAWVTAVDSDGRVRSIPIAITDEGSTPLTDPRRYVVGRLEPGANLRRKSYEQSLLYKRAEAKWEPVREAARAHRAAQAEQATTTPEPDTFRLGTSTFDSPDPITT